MRDWRMRLLRHAHGRSRKMARCSTRDPSRHVGAAVEGTRRVARRKRFMGPQARVVSREAGRCRDPAYTA